MINTFIEILNKKSQTKIGIKTSKLLILNGAYRSYFSQLNDKLGLKLRTTTSS